MSGSVKLGLYLIIGVFAIYFAVGIIAGLLKTLLGLVLPLAIVAGVGLILYGLISRKPLGGGRRYLP